MKKMWSLSCLLACTVFTSGTSLSSAAEPVSSEPGIKLQLNGQAIAFSSMPRLIDNTLMVPLRDLSEALGVQVEWDEAAKSASAKKADRSIRITAGTVQAERQNQQVQLDTAPRMEAGKLYVPARFFSESFDFNVFWDGPNRSVSIADASTALPVVGSVEHLQRLLEESAARGYDTSIAALPAAVEDSTAIVKRSPAAALKENASASASASTASETKPAFSGTNIQVEGVDEADIIKTDGSLIYQVSRNRVLITAAYPADRMKVLQTLSFDDKNFRARELYVDEQRLIVIGSTTYPVEDKPDPAGEELSVPAVQAGDGTATSAMKIRLIPSRPQRTATKAVIYQPDGSSGTFSKTREVELEGSYVSSRKVGGSLYFVTNKGLAYYPVLRLNQNQTAGTDALSSLAKQAPVYKDSAAGTDFISVGYDRIRYFPDSLKSTYLMIGGLNLDQPNQSMTVQSYLGSGSQIYASQNHLYVVAPEYTAASVQPQDSAEPQRRIATLGEENSAIYKFGLDEGAIRYIGRGTVPGYAINSFAMDENNGYFRIATTQRHWNDGSGISMSNRMYVLDESLQTIGKIEDIAPGEQIYSVRYTGDRAYMVTFRTVDPLFVIDLKEPHAPKIVGKLKIPGYSNYLHPYDENHIIGFGKDTIEVSNESAAGGGADMNVNSSSVFYQGMKMALFDISDVEHPKELFVQRIGDRGTDSELLGNHKALLFSKDQGLLAFPVTVREIDPNGSAAAGTKQEQASQYGSFTFQGAYVYKLDLTEGFTLQGKITHLTEEDYSKSGELGSDPQRNIRRILSIGDTLYTASEQLLKATELRSFQEVGAVTLP